MVYVIRCYCFFYTEFNLNDNKTITISHLQFKKKNILELILLKRIVFE